MYETPKGYTFSAAMAGFKNPGRYDLGLIVSDRPAAAAGAFTKNIFTAAPVTVCKQLLDAGPSAQAIVINSGQANACTGEEGMQNCRTTLDMISDVAGIASTEILTASTGVIGPQLRMDLWEKAMASLKANLGKVTSEDVAKAIMTTDTVHKIATAKVTLSTGTVRLLGMCKGAGMICPDMATMLGFIICDAQVDANWWTTALKESVYKSFNRITIDGDTSTNDTVLALANGGSGAVAESDGDKTVLAAALLEICRDLAHMIVQDAEGGTKVAHIKVTGGTDDTQAELVARAIGHSPLVKTALFGRDPNWGRIVAAAGRSGAVFVAEDLVLTIGGITVFKEGRPEAGDMDELLDPVMEEPEIEIGILLGKGSGEYELAASDLSREYVNINADYRS